ncbi:MAG TPA: hypothetical protein VLA89_03280 [Gemmatimonadales bacterium]|nr:hypothetical protein [Gemmatimonadales bacterium]
MEFTDVKLHCSECDEDFKVGDWNCRLPGAKHQVAPVTFYILDAPYRSQHDKDRDPMGKTFRNSRTVVENCPPERKEKGPSGELDVLPGGSVTFVRGTVTLTDSEKIYWLFKHGYGKVSEADWRRVYFSEREKSELKEIEFRQREAALAERERKVQEANDLLAATQAKVAKAATNKGDRTAVAER